MHGRVWPSAGIHSSDGRALVIHAVKCYIPRYMNIQDYVEDGRHLYEEFSTIVADILRSAIDNGEYLFSVQQIQHRAKSVKSLSKKLKDREIYHSDDIEGAIKDLAGCRVIFYHNDDLSGFLSSGIVSDNFELDWDESKFHHPDTDAKTANDYYMANHFIVHLKADRLALPEFSKLSGLRCEIQAQTLLNHAWAETGHDITYKRRESTGFGDRLMTSIDERLKTIMTDYLRPAGYEFQKVKQDYIQFVQGKKLFDSDVGERIEEVADNNALHDLLERYKDYVLPNYTEHAPYADEIYGIIRTALSKARDAHVVDIKTPYGRLAGKSYKEVLSVCLDILSYIRYLDIERTESLLIEIYPTFVDHSEEEVYAEHVERFAGYHYDVVTGSGLDVQERLLRDLLGMPDDELLALPGYVIPVCKAILQPSFEKTEWTHNQVTWGTVNLIGNEALKTVRQSAIKLLNKLYDGENEAVRTSIRLCLDIATRAPNVGDYNEDLLTIVLSNSNEIIQIYTDDIGRQSFQVLQSYEEHIYSLYARAKQVSQDEGKSKNTRGIADTTMDLVKEYRARVNSNDNYLKYKVLVGFQSVFDQEWDNERWGYEEEKEFRTEKISEYVESINDESYGEWIKVIAVCAKTDSSDLATFQYFQEFLRLLASSKPDIALRLIGKGDTGIDHFLVSILLGLVDSERLDILDTVIGDYVKRGERLWECARLFVLNPNPNRAWMTELFELAKQRDQVSVMIQLLAAVVVNAEKETDEISTLFLPIIEELTSRSNANWIHEAWFRREAGDVLGSLDINQAKIVLENLVLLTDIDYHAEQVIKPIAKTFPLAVIEYFGERIKKEKQKESGDRYDAIPYDFQQLAEPLSAVPEELLDAVLNWYNADSKLFQYRGANLVSNIFPEFDNRLECKLINLIRTRGEEIVDFITSILRNYKGESFLHGVCKVLIRVLQSDSTHLSEVRIILQESGVLHGEFGFVELCERKKQEIAHWLEDEDSKVRVFAETYMRSLDRQRAAEQRRAEEDLELRKHRYGE